MRREGGSSHVGLGSQKATLVVEGKGAALFGDLIVQSDAVVMMPTSTVYLLVAWNSCTCTIGVDGLPCPGICIGMPAPGHRE